jgi:pyrroline-5-carboxylate reductase
MAQDKLIGFIGGGNMARSLVGGLLNTHWSGDRLLVAEPDADKRDYFTGRLGVRAEAQNQGVVEQCDVVVLAVKPQVMKQVCVPLRTAAQASQPLIVSIAAGVREPSLQQWLGGGLAIVRAMPNTPALVGSGATALYANAMVTDAQRDLAETLLRAVGVTVWLDRESLLDTVTALSGSGPAYFMLFMETLEQAAIEHGLAADTARLLVLETCLGAAKLAMESGEELAELRRRVTSPGGTTEAALQVMHQRGLDDTLRQAFAAAVRRGDELATALGEE